MVTSQTACPHPDHNGNLQHPRGQHAQLVAVTQSPGRESPTPRMGLWQGGSKPQRKPVPPTEASPRSQAHPFVCAHSTQTTPCLGALSPLLPCLLLQPLLWPSVPFAPHCSNENPCHARLSFHTVPTQAQLCRGRAHLPQHRLATWSQITGWLGARQRMDDGKRTAFPLA